MKVYVVKMYDGDATHYEKFFTTESAAQKWMNLTMPIEKRYPYNHWWVEPVAVEGRENTSPLPCNRQEAKELLRLVIEHLDVIDAHIDAAISRCEASINTEGTSQ